MKTIFVLLCFSLTFNASSQSEIKARALRLTSGQDIRKELESYLKKNNIEAASILAALGSLTEVSLRYANQ